MKNSHSIKSITTATSVASLIAAGNLNANIISISGQGFTVEGNGNATGDVIAYWDIDGDGSNEFRFQAYSTSSGYIDIYQNTNNAQLVIVSSLVNLTPGTTVGPSVPSQYFATKQYSVVNSSGIFYARGFTEGEQGYMGFSFEQQAEIPITVYGWAEITLSGGGERGIIQIGDWAYEDDGSAITVGAVPEPSSAALGLGALALGAAGLRRWRKTKANKVA